ncbi:MAG: hypothetical protein Q9191_001670 [Dirinaria sp. TL-2023a]
MHPYRLDSADAGKESVDFWKDGSTHGSGGDVRLSQKRTGSGAHTARKMYLCDMLRSASAEWNYCRRGWRWRRRGSGKDESWIFRQLQRSGHGVELELHFESPRARLAAENQRLSGIGGIADYIEELSEEERIFVLFSVAKS